MGRWCLRTVPAALKTLATLAAGASAEDPVASDKAPPSTSFTNFRYRPTASPARSMSPSSGTTRQISCRFADSMPSL